MPVITTLHTLLREPNKDQYALMKQLDELSNRFIVMAERGKGFLEEIYGIRTQTLLRATGSRTNSSWSDSLRIVMWRLTSSFTIVL